MEKEFANDIMTIVEVGSISDAAKKMNISQPALSARVKRIEDDYGITIFYKDKRPAQLTDEGRRYLEFVTRMQTLDRGFRQYISDAHNLKTGELRVGGTHSYAQCFLPAAVSLFHKTYPGVKVKVYTKSVPELAKMASKGEVDLYISSPGKKSRGISHEKLADTRLYFCVPKNNPANKGLEKFAISSDAFDKFNPKKQSVDLSAFSDSTFILLNETQYMGEVMRNVFRRYGVTPSDFVYVDQAMTAYAMAAGGVGIALMFDRTIECTVIQSEPVFYSIDDDDMTGELSVAYVDRDNLSLAAKEFIRCVKETV